MLVVVVLDESESIDDGVMHGILGFLEETTIISDNL